MLVVWNRNLRVIVHAQSSPSFSPRHVDSKYWLLSCKATATAQLERSISAMLPLSTQYPPCHLLLQTDLSSNCALVIIRRTGISRAIHSYSDEYNTLHEPKCRMKPPRCHKSKVRVNLQHLNTTKNLHSSHTCRSSDSIHSDGQRRPIQKEQASSWSRADKLTKRTADDSTALSQTAPYQINNYKSHWVWKS